MLAVRQGHTTTLLSDGKVLIAGGIENDGRTPMADAELFDPATGTFSPTGNMNTARGNHTATLLSNGKVLVMGGDGTGLIPLAGAEVYDPSTGTFTPAGSLNIARRPGHTATRLLDGRVLIAGDSVNYSTSSASTAELYDPATGNFSFTGSLSAPPLSHTATLLPNGKVLMIKWNRDTELYDPVTGTFSPSGRMKADRCGAETATLLSNGKVLIAGGSCNSALASVELYDPDTGDFNLSGSMTTTRYGHTATLLSDGAVLIVGGSSGDGTIKGNAELSIFPGFE